MSDAAHHIDLLRTIYGGRPWLVAADVLPAAAYVAHQLRDLGATGALCVAGSRGTGDPPDPDFAPDPIVLGVQADTMMGGIRASLQALADLPPDAQARVDAFDPDRAVQTIEMFIAAGAPVGGRPVFGPRRPEWQRLEDKTVIDALWETTDTPHAPYAVVPSTAAALTAAAQPLDQGMGTVWVGDNREGFHGGASLLRWVRTEDEAAEAAAFLAAHSDRARVTPFLDGVPCSVHAVVFPEVTIALRPCEMMVLRRPGQSALHYARASTFWDPRPEDRAAMRATAVRVGDHLRDTLGYRGMFTLDGVMTADGFRPTELNPRFGAAAGMLLRGLPELPLLLLNIAVIADLPDIDWRPRELERLILTNADAQRGGAAMSMTHRPITEVTTQGLLYHADDHRFTATDADEAHRDATARLGPSAVGGYLSIGFNPDRTPVGPHLAPRAAAALAWADDAWDLGIGPLEAAPDLRPSEASQRGAVVSTQPRPRGDEPTSPNDA